MPCTPLDKRRGARAAQRRTTGAEQLEVPIGEVPVCGMSALPRGPQGKEAEPEEEEDRADLHDPFLHHDPPAGGTTAENFESYFTTRVRLYYTTRV